MKERILKLCKRLNKFSLDEIETISEIDSEELKPIIDGLIHEERLAIFILGVQLGIKHGRELQLEDLKVRYGYELSD